MGLCVAVQSMTGVELSHCGQIQISTVLPVSSARRGWTRLSTVKRVEEGAELLPSLPGEKIVSFKGLHIMHGSESTWHVTEQKVFSTNEETEYENTEGSLKQQVRKYV